MGAVEGMSMNHEHIETLVLALLIVIVLVGASIIIDGRFEKLEDFHEPTQDAQP